MAVPIIMDTDMGVDDALAVALALSTSQIHLAGMGSGGGNGSLSQATENMGRLLSGLGVEPKPPFARGLDQDDERLADATDIFGGDGLGGVKLEVPADFSAGNYLELYEQLIEEHGRDLSIVAIGPLTNLAALQRERPGLLEKVGRIVVMGGAVWCKGNITPHAEFNFYRDPRAAAELFAADLPVTVVPLDVTRQVGLDESHIAHLVRSGIPACDLLARMVQNSLRTMENENRFMVHDALAVGILCWPALFMQARMQLEMTVGVEQAGRCKPKVSAKRQQPMHVVISVNAVDLLETFMEQLCHEKFVV